MKNFVLSEEALKRKMLSTKKATASRVIPIIVYDIKTKEKVDYASLTEASKALNISKAAISQALLNNRILKKRYSINKKD